MGILVISIFLKLNSTNQELKENIIGKNSTITKLKNENKKLTNQKITFRKNTSIKNNSETKTIKQAERVAKQLFTKLNTWNADTWLENRQAATKYATNRVISYVGGNLPANKQKTATQQLKQLNATSELTESNIYFKQGATSKLKGIFTGSVKTTINNTKSTNNVKYQFIFNIVKNKITKISTF